MKTKLFACLLLLVCSLSPVLLADVVVVVGRGIPPAAGNHILTEDSDTITTESNDRLITE